MDNQKKFCDDFSLDNEWIQFGLGILAPHSKSLNAEINNFRLRLDKNPDLERANGFKYNDDSIKLMARFLDTSPELIALTESTTMSLALFFAGFKFNTHDEILTTYHEHYSADRSIELAAKKYNLSINKVNLFQQPETLTEQEIIDKYLKAINANTRLILLTWVNSCFGVKVPIKKIASKVNQINKDRARDKQIYIVVDGVHGFGVEPIDSIADFGVDFFASGCHKWLFGPRGTGILWASPKGWQQLEPVIPSFNKECWLTFFNPDYVESDWGNIEMSKQWMPGGFRAFEHQWALRHALEKYMTLDKYKVQEYIHNLASLCKERLGAIKGVTLNTPKSKSLSSGFVCFNINGTDPVQVSQDLQKYKIMLSPTPYKQPSLRFSMSILNTEQEVQLVCDYIEKNVAKNCGIDNQKKEFTNVS